MRATALIAAAVLALALAGCASTAQPSPPSTAPPASAPSTWSPTCQVTGPGQFNTVIGYTVTITNNTSSVQDASSILVVFLSNGQELESGSTSGPA